jgi:putative copper resistance protein D
VAAPGPLLAGLAGLALGLSVAQLLQVSMRMADSDLAGLDADLLGWLLSETRFGQAWLLRVLMLLLLILLAGRGWRGWRQRHSRSAALLGAAALITLPWSGHAGSGSGWSGALNLLVDVLHLAAAAAWSGALLGLLWLLASGASELARAALSAFARPGLRLVLLLGLSGLARSHDLVGWTLQHWSQADYGRWLLFKLALFAGMLGLAWHNRHYGLPALQAGAERAGLPRRVQGLLLAEALLLLLVLALVALLGMTVPPAHAAQA